MKNIFKQYFAKKPSFFWDKNWVKIAEEVTTLTSLQLAEFDVFRHQSKPVVIKGELSESKAVQCWSMDYLNEQLGEQKVEVYVSVDGKFPGYEGFLKSGGKGFVEMTMKEYFARISRKQHYPPIFSATEKYYIFHAPESIYHAIKNDIPDLQLVKYAQQNRETNYYPLEESKSHLWISEAGNLTPPHTDTWFENFLVQLHGIKQVLLWSPTQAPLLYIKPFGEMFARQSPVDVQRAEPKPFPLFKQAVALKAILNPGDILFIPEGWIHCVFTQSFSISVNYWCKNPTGFNDVLGNLLNYLKQLHPDLRAQYLYLLHWPESILNLTV